MTHRPFKSLLERVAYASWAEGARTRSEEKLNRGEITLPSNIPTFGQKEIVLMAGLLLARKRAARVDIRQARRSYESRAFRLLKVLFWAREGLDKIVQEVQTWNNRVDAPLCVARAAKKVVRLERELWEVAPEYSFLDAFVLAL